MKRPYQKELEASSEGLGSSDESSNDEPSTKFAALEARSSEEPPSRPLRCFLPPHLGAMTFQTQKEWDEHYSEEHEHRCSSCRKNLPSEHFLNLHISENHDPIALIRRERGEKTYGCFVEDCEKICRHPGRRRLHLLDKHFFPKRYDFFIVDSGIGKRRTMLRPKMPKIGEKAVENSFPERKAAAADSRKNKPVPEERKENTQTDQMPIDAEAVNLAKDAQVSTDCDIDRLAESLSSLKFVPHSVRFGRGRAGFAMD